jgi:RND family efflux transporter MFP subunit
MSDPMKAFFILLFMQLPAQAQWHMVQPQTIDIFRQLNGEIEAVNKATLSSQTNGRVEKLYYDVDDFVAKDSIVVEFTNTEQRAQLKQALANAKAAKITSEQAQIDYLRIKDIFAKKLVAKSELDKALSQRNSLLAKYTAAKAAVTTVEKQLEYTIIRAPYDGIVTNRYVELGETVSPGTPIMEGLSLNQLRVITHIPEKIINQVKSNPHAFIISEDEKIIASLVTIFPYAEQLTRTFKTRIELEESHSSLFPGMTVKVAFKVGEKQAITIPQSALITRSELNMVYIKSGDKKILRYVKTGSQHDNRIEIISGLNSGEQVLLQPLMEK